MIPYSPLTAYIPTIYQPWYSNVIPRLQSYINNKVRKYRRAMYIIQTLYLAGRRSGFVNIRPREVTWGKSMENSDPKDENRKNIFRDSAQIFKEFHTIATIPKNSKKYILKKSGKLFPDDDEQLFSTYLQRALSWTNNVRNCYCWNTNRWIYPI